MRKRAANALLGLVYLALAGVVVVATGLTYSKTFVQRVDVQLHTGAVGNSLREGSDVKVRGVPVGLVKTITSTDTGATLTLALEPDKAGQIPAGSTARLLPKTLFGERFVALQVPTSADVSRVVPGGAGLKNGDSISQDRSAKAVELEQVFDELLPVLQAVQPEKLSATLSELSAMLRGKGGEIGTTMGEVEAYLGKLNPLVPKMSDDLAAFARVARTYDAAAPDLLSALDDFTVTSRTLADQKKQLAATFRTATGAGNTSGAWIGDNQDTIFALSQQSRRALGAVAPYASIFPCVFRALTNFIPKMNTVLGADTDEPGLHAAVNVVPGLGKYVPGWDTPTFIDNGEPSCPDNSDGLSSDDPTGGFR